MIYNEEDSMQYWTHCYSLGQLYYNKDEINSLIDGIATSAIDDKLSTTSKNAVENRVVTKKINDIESVIQQALAKAESAELDVKAVDARIDGLFGVNKTTLILNNKK